MSEINSICVYCGSQKGNSPIFVEAARETGNLMAKNDINLVYGGGNSGIMGAVSSSVLESGGSVKGIIPRFLMSHEGWHRESERCETIITDNMHVRKQLMFDNSDAFLAMPGGIGTLEEIIEIMTWAQLGRHKKPMAFLNVDGFWDPLLNLIEHMQSAGFIHSAKQLNYIVADDPHVIIDRIQSA